MAAAAARAALTNAFASPSAQEDELHGILAHAAELRNTATALAGCLRLVRSSAKRSRADSEEGDLSDAQTEQIVDAALADARLAGILPPSVAQGNLQLPGPRSTQCASSRSVSSMSDISNTRNNRTPTLQYDRTGSQSQRASASVASASATSSASASSPSSPQRGPVATPARSGPTPLLTTAAGKASKAVAGLPSESVLVAGGFDAPSLSAQTQTMGQTRTPTPPPPSKRPAPAAPRAAAGATAGAPPPVAMASYAAASASVPAVAPWGFPVLMQQQQHPNTSMQRVIMYPMAGGASSMPGLSAAGTTPMPLAYPQHMQHQLPIATSMQHPGPLRPASSAAAMSAAHGLSTLQHQVQLAVPAPRPVSGWQPHAVPAAQPGIFMSQPRRVPVPVPAPVQAPVQASGLVGKSDSPRRHAAPAAVEAARLMLEETAARARARKVAPTGQQWIKGRMTASERQKVEDFVACVLSGEMKVRKGDLSRELREFVNPRRPPEFFEKLVSRRSLNSVLADVLAPKVSRKAKREAAAGVAALSLAVEVLEARSAPAVVPPKLYR